VISINEIPCEMCGKPIGTDHTHWTEEACPICRTCGDRMQSMEPRSVPRFTPPTKEETMPEDYFNRDYYQTKIKEKDARIAALEDALAGARVFVSMDTLPENVPDGGQRKAAEDLLVIIDTLML